MNDYYIPSFEPEYDEYEERTLLEWLTTEELDQEESEETQDEGSIGSLVPAPKKPSGGLTATLLLDSEL